MKIKSGILLTTMMLTATSAYSADGCKFLLCMGSPNPMGIPECVSTIKDVLHDLRKGRPMATCVLENGKDSKTSGTWVDYKRPEPTPDCPDGYKQGSDNTLYIKGTIPPQLNNYSRTKVNGGVKSTKYPRYERGDGWMARLNAGKYSSRACIAGQQNGYINSYSYQTRRNGEREMVTVPRQEFWTDVVYMTPDGADYEFVFHVDNQVFSKHRF